MVNSDHRTLARLQSRAHLSGRRARYAEFLQQIDCSAQFNEGRDNVMADALSRGPDLFAMRFSACRSGLLFRGHSGAGHLCADTIGILNFRRGGFPGGQPDGLYIPGGY